MAMEILIVCILISMVSIDAYGFLLFRAFGFLLFLDFWMEEYVCVVSVFSLHPCNVFIVSVESEIQTYAFI
jgi:hypothetical protein